MPKANAASEALALENCSLGLFIAAYRMVYDWTDRGRRGIQTPIDVGPATPRYSGLGSSAVQVLAAA